MIGSWLARWRLVPNPSSENDEPGNKPIKISEQFVAARRNLLWFCAILILIFLARSSGLENDKLTLPLLGAELPARILSLLVLGASVPTVYNFHFYGRRIALRNSEGMYNEEFDDIGQSLESLNSSLQSWNSKFLIKKTILELTPFVRKVLEEKAKNTQTLTQEIYKKISPVQEVIDEQRTRGELGDARELSSKHNQLSSALILVDQLKDEQKATADQLKLMTDQIDSTDLDIQSPQIQSALDAIVALRRDFETLDSSLNRSDQFKFRIMDLSVGWGVYLIAGILTIYGARELLLDWISWPLRTVGWIT